MGTPKKSLLKEKPLQVYRCQMCGQNSRKNSFSWKSWFTGNKLIICRDCAYKERYGSKNMKKAKKENLDLLIQIK